MRNLESFPRMIFYVIIFLLVVILAALFYADRQRSARYAQKYEQERLKEPDGQEEVSKKTEDKKTEDKKTEEDRQSAKQRIPAAPVEKSLPGIVCWGDAGMKGSKKASLPDELSHLVDAGTTGVSIPVVNMGIAHEGFHELMVRTGAHELFLGEDFLIPEETEQRNIVLCDEDGNSLRFAKEELDKFGRVTLGDVEGHFYKGSETYDKYHRKLAFARDAKGEASSVEEGTVIHTEGSEKYHDYLPVIFLNEQEDVTADQMIAGIYDTVSLYTGKKYVVLLRTDAGSKLDRAGRKQFGDRYIRVEKPAGNVTVMTGEDCQNLAGQIYEALDAQGAFSEVGEAVDEAEMR